MGLLFHHNPLFSEMVIAAQGRRSLYRAVGPLGLPCAGGVPPQRPPPTKRQATAALASGNYPLCTAGPIQ